MGTWNWLDWILAVIVVASVAAAIWKGFVRELISLASVVAGLVIAALGYQRAALWFDDLTRSHNVALGLGFLAMFVGTLLMILVAFAIKAEAVQKSSLAPYVTTGARIIVLAMPADLKAEFRAGFEKFKQSLIQTDKKATKD
jgi:hypothetical protein